MRRTASEVESDISTVVGRSRGGAGGQDGRHAASLGQCSGGTVVTTRLSPPPPRQSTHNTSVRPEGARLAELPERLHLPEPGE